MTGLSPNTQTGWAYAIPQSVLTLKAAGGVFDLCQFQSYISIKDQMIRARLMSEWLVSTGALGSDIKDVLVIGGGVAGVCTAALIAEAGRSAGGVAVTLADEKGGLFTTQASCTTRFVSVTQYDWPASHFASHEWPHAGDMFQAGIAPGPSFRLTLPNTPERASDLAARWDKEFKRWHAKNKALTWLPNTKALIPNSPPTQPPITVTLIEDPDGTARQRNQNFDLVIFAAGFGKETIPDIGGSVSKAFWQTDDYADPRTNANKGFAIIGLGDGALQDFLRLVCAPAFATAFAIVERIRREFLTRASAVGALTVTRPGPLRNPPRVIVHASSTPEEEWTRLLRDIAEVDRQAALAAPWDSKSQRGSSDLQNDVERIVDRFAAAFAPVLVPAIDAVLRTQRDALSSITLIAPEVAPSKCYMLNRFLFTLIRWRLLRGTPALTKPRFAFVQESVKGTQIKRTSGGYSIAVTLPVTVHEIVWRGGIDKSGTPNWSQVEGFRVAVGKHALPFYPPDRFR